VADRFLLDTSAIFALTDHEPGADQVESLLDQAAAGDIQVRACSASLMEVYYVSLQEKGENEAVRVLALVKSWPLTWIYPDEKTHLLAARIKATHRLSFADALIAATASVQGAVLVHKDPELGLLGDELALLELPLKHKAD
jgi:predicted nucleic acid-binding protein